MELLKIALLHVVLCTVGRRIRVLGQRIPLKEESLTGQRHTLPGCWLGENFYKFGERWSPVIKPFGLRVCVKCQCGSVARRGVIEKLGRVVCKNIHDQCLVPRCDLPVLRENTCCKVCPDTRVGYQGNFTGTAFEDEYTLIPNVLVDTSQDVVRNENSKDDNGKDKEMDSEGINNDQTDNKIDPPVYTALLVGNEARGQGSVRTRAVALVHISALSENSISYAIRYKKVRKLMTIQVTDQKGMVLMERSLISHTQHTDKICGIWRNIPHSVMANMADEKLTLTLTSAREGGDISGRLLVMALAGEEHFSAILSTTEHIGLGGVAMLKYDVTDQSAIFSLTLEGINIITSREEYLVTFGVGSSVYYQLVLKPDKKTGLVSGSIKLRTSLSKRLARGRLELRVTSVHGTMLRGCFQPRLSCSVYQTGLVVNDDNHKAGSGWAAISIQENGGLLYKIQMSSDVEQVFIQRLVKGRKWRTFQNVTNTFQTSTRTGTGLITKTHARDISSLLTGKLSVLVVTKTRRLATLRGVFMATPYMEKIDVLKDSPVVTVSNTCPVVAYVWLTLARDCALYHHLTLPWLQERRDYTFKLVSPGNSHVGNRTVDISINQFPRRISRLPDVTLASLHAGLAVVDIDASYITGCDALRANVTRPNTCWLKESGEGETPGTGDDGNDVGERFRYSCFYEGRFYSDGESWKPSKKDDCHTCTCQSGRLRCHHVICPPLNCSKSVNQEGQCCPVCEELNSTEKKPKGSCYFQGDKRWHPVDTTWHPYVPPFGYAKCAICTCLPGIGVFEVNCTRVQCPPLNCHSYQRYREHRDDCCLVCRAKQEPVEPEPEETRTDRTRTTGCTFGGDFYRNGAKWKPYVPPFGPMKCYECRCKDSKTKCRKRRCKPLACKRQFRPSGFCCPVCLGREHEKRRRRGHRKRMRQAR